MSWNFSLLPVLPRLILNLQSFSSASQIVQIRNISHCASFIYLFIKCWELRYIGKGWEWACSSEFHLWPEPHFQTEYWFGPGSWVSLAAAGLQLCVLSGLPIFSFSSVQVCCSGAEVSFWRNWEDQGSDWHRLWHSGPEGLGGQVHQVVSEWGPGAWPASVWVLCGGGWEMRAEWWMRLYFLFSFHPGKPITKTLLIVIDSSLSTDSASKGQMIFINPLTVPQLPHLEKRLWPGESLVSS